MEILGLAVGLGLLIVLVFPKAQTDRRTESALAKDDYKGAARSGCGGALFWLVVILGFVALILVPFGLSPDAAEVYPGSAPKEVVLVLLVVIAGGAVWGIGTMSDAKRLTEAKAKQLEAQGRDSSGVSCAYLLIMAGLFALAGVGVVIAKTTPGFLP